MGQENRKSFVGKMTRVLWVRVVKKFWGAKNDASFVGSKKCREFCEGLRAS